jgi:NADPH-dependent 2,4-dienoyl-CoA reductase/sulfur reductase-like enzyme
MATSEAPPPAPGHPDVTAAARADAGGGGAPTRVAVVGSGITGLATAWLLHKCVFLWRQA